MSQPQYAVSVAVLGLLLVTAGCSGIIGEGALTFEASPVNLSADALEETGYEELEVREISLNRTIEFQDSERELKVTNHIAIYGKQVSGESTTGESERQSVGVSVIATPKATFAGVPLNPVGEMSAEDLVHYSDRVGARYGGELTKVRHTESWEATVLGNATTVETFEATITKDGQTVDVVIHIGRVSDGDDYVLVIAAYPKALEQAGAVEKTEIRTLFEGVNH